MEQLIEQLQELLEIDSIDLTKKFNDYDEWDSLAALSVMALLDSDYGMAIKNSELTAFKSIKEFCEYVLANRK